MSQWPSAKAKRVLAALLKLGWQTASIRTDTVDPQERRCQQLVTLGHQPQLGLVYAGSQYDMHGGSRQRKCFGQCPSEHEMAKHERCYQVATAARHALQPGRDRDPGIPGSHRQRCDLVSP